jgi:predicted PurR-regulated permease PerM
MRAGSYRSTVILARACDAMDKDRAARPCCRRNMGIGMRGDRILMMLLLGGVAVGCTLVLYPFFSAILWAAILTYTTWPLFQWCRRRLRLGTRAAAGLMVGAMAVLVVLPLALAVPGSSADVDRLRQEIAQVLQSGLPEPPAWVGTLPLIGPSLAERWSEWAEDLSTMVAFFRPYFGMAGEVALGVLLGLANGVLLFLLALFVAFFFYASGEKLAELAAQLLRRIAGEQADRLLTVTGATIRGVVYGILGTAVVQGILTGMGLWLVGVPRAWLLGVIAAGLSVLPIGAPVVWIPAGLWLISTGSVLRGVALLIYGVVAVSGSDSVIRPYFIARGANLPFLLTMLGVLGGALAFGLLGVFVGPVLLGVGYTLVMEYAEAKMKLPPTA